MIVTQMFLGSGARLIALARKERRVPVGDYGGPQGAEGPGSRDVIDIQDKQGGRAKNEL